MFIFNGQFLYYSAGMPASVLEDRIGMGWVSEQYLLEVT